MYDVIVIGGGFAGAAALARLAGHGPKLLLAEASGRLGGRAYARAFAGGEDVLDFGGAWVTLGQQRVRNSAALHGIALRPRPAVSRRAWFDGVRLREEAPVSSAARKDFERVMARIASDAERCSRGLRTDSCGHDVAGASFNAYLARIGAGRPARAQAMAWWSVSGGGDPAVVSAAEFLANCAYCGGRMDGMMDRLAHTLEPGASHLVERMVAASGAEVAMDATVTAVEQDETGIEVRTADGRAWRARYAIVAVPLNTLGAITFTPCLGCFKTAAAARGHGGRAIKLWLELDGAEVGTLATGGLCGLNWLFVEREARCGTTLAVAFAVDDGRFDPSSRAEVAAATKRLLPAASLVGYDWTDWVGDPFARGTWPAVPADMPDMVDVRGWGNEGRVMFAGSDISGDDVGWFEGALASGEAASGDVLARLSGAGLI